MSYLLAFGCDARLGVYDYSKTVNKQIFSIEQQSLEIKGVSWSPDTLHFVACTSAAAYIYDHNGVLFEEITVPEGTIQAGVFGWKTSRFIYIVASKLFIYDRIDSKFTLQAPVPNAVSIALSTDDQKVALGCSDGNVLIYSLKTNTVSQLLSKHKERVSRVAFYPFKKSIVASACIDGSISVWDINQKLEPQAFKPNAHNSPITDLSFAPCNKHFFCTVGLDKTLRFHDINSSTKGQLQFYEAEMPLISVTINDEHTVAIGDSSGNIHIYDVRLKKVVSTVATNVKSSVSCLLFQPPKWAIDSCAKSSVVFTPKLPQKPASSSNELMDMFSPVRAGPRNGTDLRKAALINNMDAKIAKAAEMHSAPPKPSCEEIAAKPAQLVHLNPVNDRNKANDSPKPAATESPKQDSSRLESESNDVGSKGISESPELMLSRLEQARKLVSDQEHALLQSPEQILARLGEKSKNMSTEKADQFQYAVIRNIVDEVVSDYHDQLRKDINNMHLELIRQFQMQKIEMQDLLERYLPSKQTREELEALRLENNELKLAALRESLKE